MAQAAERMVSDTMAIGDRCYAIERDASSPVIMVLAHGFWSPAIADAYFRELKRFTAEDRAAGRRLRILVDRRGAPDQGFAGYTTFDLGVGYNFGAFSAFKNLKLSLNVANLTNKRYAANFDNSVFAPSDPTGTVVVAHSSAPRQFFGTVSAAF